MANKTDLFITTTELIEIHGSTNIPTVLFYRTNQNPLFGSEALSRISDRDQLNEDFKVDLGNSRPGTAPVKRYRSADGKDRSAAELAADFIHEVITSATLSLAQRDVKPETSILVAEPLAMQGGIVPESWLANYRNYIRRILVGKGFKTVEFLPEPFAVYQYYRYSEKHPLVAERRKHYALVLDFGGGTFDTCLIETTKTGDISESGRMARPISASSIPVGGFHVNRVIAEDLIRKVLTSRNVSANLNRAFDLYRRWRRDDLDLASLSPEYRSFIRNYHGLSYRVEEAKLTLCRLLRDWSLDSAPTLSVPVAVPNDPFVPDSSIVNLQLSAAELRHIFVSKIWDKELKPGIKLTLQRGREELNGAPITVVLLSGGSANIGWLSHLLRNDFAPDLQNSELLQLKDFQEVVSKGLAVECARRSRPDNRNGDFANVTYNRLCCILDPDDTGLELKKFLPKDDALAKSDIPGILLPSASIISQFKDRPMRWRVHLDKAPRRNLNYYFLRSSLDPNDIVNLQNLEEHVIYTPRNCSLDQDLTLELTVAEDGTTTPKFIYKQGRTESETVHREGRPFYLDMTTGDNALPATAYIGLDFGTSNTSVSYVDQTSIQFYRRRSHEKDWNELGDLSTSLPYPLAAPLANYLCQTDQQRLANAAREFLESALTMAAYVAYLDHCCSLGRADVRLFKSFTKRSAGPLWGLFQESMKQSAGRRSISSGYDALLEPGLFEEINQAVSLVAQHKHGKISDSSANVLRPVQILANVSQQVFEDLSFGYFQQVQKQRFATSYEGAFRRAHGRPPFVQSLKYQGTISFSDNETYVVNQVTRKALSLEPLILWSSCPLHPELENGHCYLYDSVERDGTYTYKAVGFTCVLKAGTGGHFVELSKQLKGMFESDKPVYTVDVGLEQGDHVELLG